MKEAFKIPVRFSRFFVSLNDVLNAKKNARLISCRRVLKISRILLGNGIQL